MLRLRPNGVDGFITNNIEHCMKKNTHWSCQWIYIKDNTVKIIVPFFDCISSTY